MKLHSTTIEVGIHEEGICDLRKPPEMYLRVGDKFYGLTLKQAVRLSSDLQNTIRSFVDWDEP
jgi:hypothetical protein